MKCIKSLWIINFLFFCSISYTQDQEEYLIQSNTTDKTFQELSDIGEAYYIEKGTAKGTGYKPFKRWQYWSSRNLDADGRIISKAEAFKEVKEFRKQVEVNRSVNGDYTEMGPLSAVNTSTWSSHIGRLTSIDVHDTDANHILVSAPGGGVWHTLDLGTTWVPLFDEEAVIEVLSVNINHADANDYIVGTASGGIFRSLDQGATWSATTGPTNDWFIDIKRHPTDATILFATGRFFGQTWRSTNSGDNWTVVDDQSAQVHDLEFKPGDPTTIYISGNGFIRKSTDTGATWSALTSGGTWGTNSNNTIMIAVTPAAPNELFVIEEQSGGLQGLYKSTDSGTSFTTIFTYDGTNNYMGYELDEQTGQGPRDMDIAVSPNDEDIIHIAGIETWKSTDGGTSFTQSSGWRLDEPIPFIHGDIDQLIYHDDRIFAATDGGIFYSDDDAATWVDKSQGLGIRQFYKIGASQTMIDRVGGGSQDNGTGIVKSGIWHDWVGADGMETFIDWNNASITYGNLQFGALYKSIDGGETHSTVTQTPGLDNGITGAWVTPMEQDPMVANTLYQAKLEVFKSTDGADTWNAISDFDGGLIYEMKLAPSDNQTIYIAFDHDIYKTVDGGTNWTDITPTFTYASATSIAVHPTNPNRLSLTLSGAVEKVIESTDGGTTWVDITSNLPSIGSQCVLYENDNADAIYVGMNPGLYFKDNTTGGNWTLVNAAMPNVSVTELEARNGILYIATYGRGLWKIDLLENEEGESCLSPSVTIPDGSDVTSSITLGTGGIITHVNVYVGISQDYVGDLSASLKHVETGTVVVLFDRPGVPASSFGCDNQNIDCTFDDQSNNGTVEDVCNNTNPAYSGDYNPMDLLSAFNGEDRAGTWELLVSDFTTPDEGTLDTWCLTITTCPANYTGTNKLTGPITTTSTFATSGSIESEHMISGAVDVIYSAEGSVDLLEGFSTEAESTLEINSDGCPE